ncbi:MAG: sialate O-acetylesterase, partial [Phycisphaeraceae bacterium]|nr:sialate O-acetylesterase [Phycisphaeraceae bacterium]
MRLIHLTALAALLALVTPAPAAKPAPVDKPLKVYLLVGQSNMVGLAHVKTFEHIKMIPEAAENFRAMFNEDGSPVVLDEVRIVSTVPGGEDGQPSTGPLAPGFGGRPTTIGPEYTFGIYMYEALQEPILLIKAAWGGKSLYHDFRPPRAGEWTPPAGHPDLVEEEPEVRPIPEKLDLPADYVPDEKYTPAHQTPRRFAYFLGIPKMRGVTLHEINGVNPIYIASDPKIELEGNPFQKGDLILGVNGSGMLEDAKTHYRREFYGEFERDWLLQVTRWRNGKITTFDFDLSYRLENGRAGIPEAKAE